MDYIQEGFALGMDLLFLGLCVKEYLDFKRNITLLKNIPQLNIDKALVEYVGKEANNRVPYAAIRGTVAPIGVPLKSLMQPNVSGVLQIIKMKEHRIARGFAGFWTEQEKLIHFATNEVPFELIGNNVGVEIVDGLSAAFIDMDMVYDNYERANLSLIDHIVGFFTGIRQKGIQTTEEILRDGNFVTAIGELELDGKTLRLQRSPLGPLYLTTSSKATLIKKLEEDKYGLILKIIICGSIAAFIVTTIMTKYLAKRKQKREDSCLHDALEKQRKERRALSRPSNLSSEQLCVVCCTNPKEVIVLPCGHVCLCEDCSERIKNNCPLCRSKIVTRAAAFIS